MDDMLDNAGGAEPAVATRSPSDARPTILDIVDVERLRRLIKQFSRVHGIAVGLVDHNTQEIMLQSGWTEICRKFHRADKAACRQCKASDRHLVQGLNARKMINITHCPHGLVDGATPVIVGGEHLADMCIGQVLFEKPDLEQYRENARKFGFAEEDYLRAVAKVRVINRDQFTAMLHFISDLAGMIGEMGVNYLKLNKKEAQNRQLIETTQEAMAVIRDGVFLYVNPACSGMLGYAGPLEMIGRDMFDLIDPAYHALVAEDYRRRMNDEPVDSNLELSLNHRDGHQLWVEVNSEIVNFDGESAALVALHDITRRKRAELERQELIEEINATNDVLNATNEELIATNEELADTIKELNNTNTELNTTYEELNSTYEELHATHADLELSEEELRASEEYYRALIENAAEGIAIINQDGTLIDESHSDGKLLGYANGQMLGESVLDKIHPDDVGQIAAALDRLVQAPGSIVELQMRFLHANGSWRVLQTTCQNLLDHPQIKGVVINYRDITERREAEDRLRTSEERYRELVNNMSEGMVAVDQDERLVFANPAAEELFGYNNGELIGRNLAEFTDSGTYANIVSKTHERSSGLGGEYEITVRRPDGAERNVLVTASPMRGPGQTVVGAYGLLRDITERKLADRKLQQSEAQFRALVENSPDIIVRYDQELRIVYVNPVIEAITGESAEGMIGKTYAELGYPAEQYESWERKITQVFDSGKPVQAEITVGSDGRLFEWRLNPVFHNDGRVHTVLGTLTDITERKQLTDRLIREQKDESMLTLAGGIAHDFNNILIGVLGSASMLHDSFDADEFRVTDQQINQNALELCSTIITSSRRMSDLTNKLLSYARGGSFQKQAVDLTATINDTLAMVRGRIPSNIKVKLDLAEDIRPAQGDPGQLHQVWLNLIINAEEAMPHGGRLQLTAINRVMPEEWICSLGHHHPPGDYIYATVADEGEGMDAETASRVFEPFFSTKFQGRGLGLAAVNGIIVTHGGCIHVTSRVGVGSTFHIHLPCADTPVIKLDLEDQAEARPGETVLIVDDEEIVRLTARRMLQRRGFRVLAVTNATDGLQLIRNQPDDIDLVLFDMHMPRVSGLEFFRALRQLDTKIRAVAISGYNEAVALQDLDTAKLDAFIQKPFTFKSLVAKIREVLDRPPGS